MNQLPELDYVLLDREMDRTKTKTFLSKNAAFLGPLMCSMNFSWVEDIETACTNGVTLWWNPHFFLSMEPKVRTTILLHELWHPGFLHIIRRGDRDPKVWNYAADIVINNMLLHEGHTFGTFKPWFDFKYDGWTTEAIYDDLMDERQELLSKFSMPQWMNPLTGLSDESDMVEPEDGDAKKAIENTILNNVVAASHSAAISGSDVPGEVEVVLKRFLTPKLPWDRLLYTFFNELAGFDYSWARPNRRYRDIYLPSLLDDRNGLDHIIYYQDVSGSISDGDSIRFNSEFKHVKETFQPAKMTFVQFDTIIQKEDVFMQEDPFDEIKIIGRGGTCLKCVREHIIKNEPTAVVIFSDLQCTPMVALPPEVKIPIIWIALDNAKATVPHGQLVHLRE